MDWCLQLASSAFSLLGKTSAGVDRAPMAVSVLASQEDVEIWAGEAGCSAAVPSSVHHNRGEFAVCQDFLRFASKQER
jgi:hypothetical protein